MRKRASGQKAGYTRDDHVAAYAQYGSVRKAAEALGVHHKVISKSLLHADMQPSKTELYGNLGGQTKTIKRAVPKSGVKRYIVTAAQTETKINEGFWNNLLALAAHYNAEILVAPFAYNKQAFGHQSNGKPGKRADDNELFAATDPAVASYLVSDRVQLAKGLVFCGEVQILPTAVDPLSGLETYTGRASGIFPHAKIEMRSIPSMRDEPTKFNYTTGCVTRHNYIQKKAGQKGEFHHAYGALIVEVTKDGWWVRQLNADKNNVVFDLDVGVFDGVATDAITTAEALVCGDVHVAELDPEVKEATWGEGGLVDLLKPRVQVLHDVFDMRSRPWQDEQSFHRQFEKHVKGQENVEDEVRECATVLGELCSKTQETVVVRSNHDLKLEKWLDTGDYKKDLPNAPFFLQAQLAKVEAILSGDKGFKVLEWALKKNCADEEMWGQFDAVRFLAEDESFILCPDAGGGIEAGCHGHRGPNGSRGTPKGFMSMARKMIIGDKHTAGIYGGVYVTGTCTGKGVDYAKGPSSWSPTHCVVYPNGKRALVTMWNGRFFAPRDGL